MSRAFLDRGRPRTVELRPEDAVVDGKSFAVRAEALADGRLRLTTPEGSHLTWVTVEGRRTFVTLDGHDYVFEAGTGARRAHAHDSASGEVTMPMPGLVISVSVGEGEAVKRGQPLLVVEAMKMEHTLRAPRDGVVRRLAAAPGKLSEGGAVLLEVEG